MAKVKSSDAAKEAKKLAKKQRKEQKKAKAKQRATNKARKGLICPKCSHPVNKHGWYMPHPLAGFLGTSQSAARPGCKGQEQKKGDDGYLHSVECQCDLGPVDAEKNARAGLKNISTSALESLLPPLPPLR